MSELGKSTYLYSFDYIKKGMEGMFPIHAMDVFLIFGIFTTIVPEPLDDRDRAVTKLMTDLIVNFNK